MISAGLVSAAALVAAAQEGAPSESPWRTLVETDVAAVCDNIKGIHPGMADPLTPDFAGRVDAACEQAAESAATAHSYSDWRDTLQPLIMSFRDGHLNLRHALEPVRIRWPGFLVDGRLDGYVVRYPDGLTPADNAPPEGARLVSCDGVAADALMIEHLDGRTADLSKEPERLRQAYRLLVDERTSGAPPIDTCVFDTEAGEVEVTLAWSTIARAELSANLTPFTRRIDRGLDVEWLPDGGAWITLGHVRYEGPLKELEAELIADQDRLRAAPYVVWDVRGGRGGNSTWGDRLGSILWGEEFVEARRLASQTYDPNEYGKYWRTSPAAVEGVRAVGDELAAEGPEMAEVAAFWHEMADTLSAEHEKGEALYKDPWNDPDPLPETSEEPTPAYSGKTFVLVDAGAFSSSVVVMNAFKRNGAIHVGEPSGQNEVYGESLGPFDLPSGLGSYRVPVTIIRQPRSSLGGLPPDVAWPGAMDDDEGLKAFIADVAAG